MNIYNWSADFPFGITVSYWQLEWWVFGVHVPAVKLLSLVSDVKHSEIPGQPHKLENLRLFWPPVNS